MSRSTFASIAALVSFVYAIPGLVATDAVASLYGVTLDRTATLLSQLLASSYLGYAIINWTTRFSTDPTVWRSLGIGNLVAWAISGIISTLIATSGLTNAMGWVGVGLSIVFTVGWGYFTFAVREAREAAAPVTAPR
ncbi:MAG: hypothetical protein E6J15_06740 [Chloroflexi bacterium]|nr:MAG: hypothetical protein E6J15_06740 [Chloroflexota bacterium]